MQYFGFVNKDEHELEVFINKNDELVLKIKEQYQFEEDATFYQINEDDIDKIIEALKSLRRELIK